MFSGTCVPRFRSLPIRQASTPIRDESYLPLLRALPQKLRPTRCLLVCIPFMGDHWIIPEGVADLLVGNLREWVVSIQTDSDVWGSGCMA
eukprot:1157441-Pelagomonas_calceolata.AAC.11